MGLPDSFITSATEPSGTGTTWTGGPYCSAEGHIRVWAGGPEAAPETCACGNYRFMKCHCRCGDVHERMVMINLDEDATNQVG